MANKGFSIQTEVNGMSKKFGGNGMPLVLQKKRVEIIGGGRERLA